MEALQTLVPLALTLSLAGLVAAVGLHASAGDLLYVARRPALLARAVLAVIVIPPIVAGVIVSLLPLESVAKAGIMLMAISPVPPLAPGKQLAVGARKEYAYGLYVVMALMTIISVPIVLAIVTALFGREDFISVGAMAESVFLGVLAPLGVGVVVRSFAPRFAERAWSIVYKLSMALVVLAFLAILIKASPAFLELIGNGTLIAMGAATAIALFVGHTLGGPDPNDRPSLAMAASVRHPGVAMSIAGAHFDDPRVSAAILLFLLVGIVVSAPYQNWIKHRRPAHPAHA